MSDEAQPIAEKPLMPDNMREMAEDAKRRMRKKLAPPDIDLSPTRRGEPESFACPFREEDEDLWWALLLECFGTRVYAVGDAFMRQLAALCPEVWYDDGKGNRPEEEALYQALAIVYACRVRNEAEACLAAQLVAVHFAMMRVGKSASRTQWLPLPTANCMAALVKAYTNGLKALQDMKGGRKSSRQTIRVEKHVHYHSEQHVHLGRGAGKLGGQSDESAELRARDPAPDERPALPGPNEGGQVVPWPGDEGQAGVPSPRRQGGRASR